MHYGQFTCYIGHKLNFVFIRDVRSVKNANKYTQKSTRHYHGRRVKVNFMK